MELLSDRRAQSVQIGALLLFLILVIAFAGYQAAVVPQQNAGVEFNHDRHLQAQFTELRNDIVNAAASGRSTFGELTLGTQYPPRLVAINPPAPVGTVQTTDVGTITVESGGQLVDPVCRGADETRHLEYRASYNEFRDNPTYRYENTVVYRKFDDGAVRFDSDQRLLSDRTVNLVALQGSFFRSGTEAIAVEAVPGITRTRTVVDPTIRLPTELGSDEWNELLGPELDDGESATVEGGDLVLELDGAYRVACLPVGIDGAPPAGHRSDGGLGDGIGDDEQINPGGMRDVVLEDVGIVAGTGNREVELRFRNRADEERTFERARMSLYYAPGTGPGSRAQEEMQLLDTGDTLDLRGEYVDLSEPIAIPAGGTTTITVRFPAGAAGDLLGLSFVDDRDIDSLYLFGIEGALEDEIEDPPEDGPTIEDVVVSDDSDPGPPDRARYDVTVEVDHGETFGGIEVTFDGESETETQTETDALSSYEFEYEGAPGTAGETYEITVEAYDGDGRLSDSWTVVDVADGTDP